MKQQCADSEDHQRAAGRKHAPSGWLIVLLCRAVSRIFILEPARQIVVDGIGWNCRDAQQARERHGCEKKKDGAGPPDESGCSSRGGSTSIAGVDEHLVTPDPICEGAAAENTECHGGKRGWKKYSGSLCDGLRCRN